MYVIKEYYSNIKLHKNIHNRKLRVDISLPELDIIELNETFQQYNHINHVELLYSRYYRNIQLAYYWCTKNTKYFLVHYGYSYIELCSVYPHIVIVLKTLRSWQQLSLLIFFRILIYGFFYVSIPIICSYHSSKYRYSNSFHSLSLSKTIATSNRTLFCCYIFVVAKKATILEE